MNSKHFRVANIVWLKTWSKLSFVGSNQAIIRNSFFLSNGFSNFKYKGVVFHYDRKFMSSKGIKDEELQRQQEYEKHKNNEEFEKQLHQNLFSKKKQKIIFLGAVLFSIVGYALQDNEEHLDLGPSMEMDTPIPELNFGGINIFPLVKKIYCLLPENTRRSIGIKMVSSSEVSSTEKK